jgi:hypothetical protein
MKSHPFHLIQQNRFAHTAQPSHHNALFGSFQAHPSEKHIGKLQNGITSRQFGRRRASAG